MNEPRGPWRCFHCDEVFTDEESAEAHFGESMCAEPFCQMTAEEMRELQLEVYRYRNEDTELHREIRKLETDHAIALRRAEETGYARGLKDAREVA